MLHLTIFLFSLTTTLLLDCLHRVDPVILTAIASLSSPTLSKRVERALAAFTSCTSTVEGSIKVLTYAFTAYLVCRGISSIIDSTSSYNNNNNSNKANNLRKD